MKKGLVASIIQLLVIGCVLALTVVSFAWFTSNQTVKSTNVILTAAMTSDVAITILPQEDIIPYKGETGLGYVDAENPDLALDIPYSAVLKFDILCDPLSTGYAFCTYFTDFSIVMSNDTVINTTTDPLISEAFTFRLHIYDEATSNITATYGPDESGFVVLTSGTAETNGDYLYVTEKITMHCGFELIFLDETSYLNWLDADYQNITEFRYDDYDYMRAVFSVVFEAGINIP